MRASDNHRRPDPPTDTETTSGRLDPGTQNGLEGIMHLLGVMESGLSDIHERVGRLETDVRNLQGQNANRS